MKKRFLILFFLFSLFPSHGCLPLALRLSPSLLPGVAASFFEECDPELGKDSMPSNLKLMEGLLNNDPENRQVLTTLAMGFSGYSLLFVEDDNPLRASNLHLRARDYGMRAIGSKGHFLKDPSSMGKNFKDSLGIIEKSDLEAFFWLTLSWNAWINLNLDKPSALAQLSITQACLEKIMELEPGYFHGLPYVLMGVSLSARPQMLGGDLKEAKKYFEEALQHSQRKFFLAHYYYARFYAVGAQDKQLFLSLLQEIIEGTPGVLKEVCLVNRIMQQKALKLKERSEDLFF